eukprot:m.115953 g.115953  ORF g.115953 m.115953 type:complete len:203 (-) comp15383_c0_seq1:219-827(-)
MGQTLVTSPSSPSYGFQSWTSSDLNVAIDEVNDICARLSSQGQRRLRFHVAGSEEPSNVIDVPESGFFWRAIVRIAPTFVSADGREEQCHRSLSLAGFARVYNFIKASCDEGTLTHSVLNFALTTTEEDEAEKCIICCENPPQEVLPCTHSFCEGCLKTWDAINPTCPICREAVPRESDRFVNVQKPSDAEVNDYLLKCFMR